MAKPSKSANPDAGKPGSKAQKSTPDPYLAFAKQVNGGTNGPETAQPEAPDPFDPERFRIDPSKEMIGVKKLLTTVPVRKPKAQDFVRVHPDEEYRRTFALIEFDREFYLLTREIARDLPGEFRYCAVFAAVNRAEKIFLWPVKLPDADGRVNDWHRTMGEAALLAQTQWVRVRADMALGAYEISVAEAALSEPVWPEVSFRELLRIGFKGRVVEDFDHLIVKKLRGLV